MTLRLHNLLVSNSSFVPQAASSEIASFLTGTTFQSVLSDPIADPSKTQRILLVSGKLYYELVKERGTRQLENEVAIIRVEELCPFPFAHLKSTLQPFFQQGSNPRIAWVQEEAENQGGWPHAMPRLLNTLKGMGLRGKGVDVEYVGREPSEVPAVGVGKLHAAQNAAILKGAFE
jgi:probable 2-oxoglutarate dehydrogenase E1 component DHKTD1